MPEAHQHTNMFERRAVFLLALLGCILTGIAIFSVSNFDRRLGDFQVVRNALEAYKAKNGAYPKQAEKDLVIGLEKTDFGSDLSKLVPSLLAKIPRDPRNLEDHNRQYLYFSNGTDFKLITHAPEDFGYVSRLRPDLVDPRRPTFAYGVWTSGAMQW